MASQATIDKLVQQILARDTSNWTGEGFGTVQANAKDMARVLAEAGIEDINQFGVKEVPLTYTATINEGGDTQEIAIPGKTRQVYINKATGEEINPQYDRAQGNIWSGTFAGQGSTGYGVQFDAQGNPQFYTQYGGTTSDWVPFRDEFLKPAALMAGAAYLGGGLGGAGAGTSAAAGDIAFAAADAAQLAAQGLGEAQIAQTLATTGLDAFVAADMAQLAAQGLGASQIASTVGATAAGTGPGLFGNLGAAQTVAQGVAEFPNAAGAANAAQAAATTPPASAPTATPASTTPAATQVATSGASGLLSGLTPAQISSLLQAGVGLLGAGAAGSALGGGGTQAISPTSLPQQAPAKYDQNYFDALNAYYGTYLPGQEANTSMLQSWYNRQPYQVDKFQMPVMAGQAPQQPVTPQQPTGDNMGFFSNLFGSLFGQYLKPNRVTPAAPAPTVAPSLFNTPAPAVTPAPAASSVVPTPSTDQYGFTTGGSGNAAYGGFSTKEEYNRAVAQKAAEDAAKRAELMAYQVTGTSGYGDLYNRAVADPSLLRKFANESDEDALLRLKSNIMDAEQRMARRTAIQQGGNSFIVS